MGVPPSLDKAPGQLETFAGRFLHIHAAQRRDSRVRSYLRVRIRILHYRR